MCFFIFFNLDFNFKIKPFNQKTKENPAHYQYTQKYQKQ